MRHFQALALGLLALPLSAAPASAGELRTYQFVPDGSLPYAASCGECGPPYLGARADVSGTFTVMLNEAAGTGSLVALDDQLINYFSIISTPSGPELQPGVAPDLGIIPPWSVYELPLAGKLTSAAGALTLTFDSGQPPGGVLIGEPLYQIVMSGKAATFNMDLPIIDYTIKVTNAAAVQVPEPSSCRPLLFAATLLFRSRR
jgi:hypothetical protein